MRSKGTAAELEHRRRLAVLRLGEGWSRDEVAEFLGVTVRSVDRWAAAHRAGGDAALKAEPHAGRPKLTAGQEAEVLGWLARKPSEFGYPTELWTCKRLAALILKHFKVSLHPRYLPEWLHQRRYSPQKPEVHARERDAAKVAAWLADDWERLKKKPPTSAPTSC